MRLLHRCYSDGPKALRDALLYATPRLVAPRLPSFVARYEDRSFELPANQGLYAQIFTLGDFEAAQSETVRGLLRPGDLAVDVGANLGWFSLLMAACVQPHGEVLAIEPMPPTLAALERNISLNPALPVKLVPLAVGAQQGDLEIHLFEGLSPGHASAATLGRSDYETFRVQVRTLDELLDQERIPAFVKVDVEGSELDVLSGAEGLIASETPPIWMLEVNYETSRAFGYRPVEMIDPFRKRGRYELYRVTETGLVREKEPADAPDGANWVFVPEAYRDRTDRYRVMQMQATASAPKTVR